MLAEQRLFVTTEQLYFSYLLVFSASHCQNEYRDHLLLMFNDICIKEREIKILKIYMIRVQEYSLLYCTSTKIWFIESWADLYFSIIHAWLNV